MNTTGMTVLSGFWQKNSLGPLGVNLVKEKLTPQFPTLFAMMPFNCL